MTRQTTRTATSISAADHVGELADSMRTGTFWRLVPEWWPLESTAVTVELTLRVERGPRRSLDEE